MILCLHRMNLLYFAFVWLLSVWPDEFVKNRQEYNPTYFLPKLILSFTMEKRIKNWGNFCTTKKVLRPTTFPQQATWRPSSAELVNFYIDYWHCGQSLNLTKPQYLGGNEVIITNKNSPKGGRHFIIPAPWRSACWHSASRGSAPQRCHRNLRTWTSMFALVHQKFLAKKTL
jgi:hypothetical protein